MAGHQLTLLSVVFRLYLDRRIVFISCILVLSFQLVTAQNITDHYRVVEWGHKEGISLTFKNNIRKDINGFLWITSPLGINRFDGGKFRIYNPEGSGNSSYSFSIVEDSLHNLWIGTNKGILYYNTRIDSFINIFPKAGTGNDISTIMPISADSEEVFCVESSTQIISYNIHSFQRKLISTLPESLTNKNKLLIQFAVFDPGTQSIYINKGDQSTDSMGLIKVDVSTGNTVTYSWPCFLHKKHNDNHGALCLDEKRKLIWINSGDGLISFNLITGKAQPVEYFMNLPGYQNAVGINKDKNENIWVASSSHGILIYDPVNNSCSPLFSDSLIQKQTGEGSYSIYFDDNDMVWVGYYIKKNMRQLIPFTPSVKTISYSSFHSNVINIKNGLNGKVVVNTEKGIMEWNPESGAISHPDKRYPEAIFLGTDSTSGYSWLLSYRNAQVYSIVPVNGKISAIKFPLENGRFPFESINTNLVYNYRGGLIFMADGNGIYQLSNNDPVAKKIIPLNTHITNFVLADQDYIFIRHHYSSRNLTYKNTGDRWTLELTPVDKINWSSITYDKITKSYWVGALQELYHFDQSFNLIKKYSTKEGIETLDLINLIVDNKNQVWFNSHTGEIWNLNANTGIVTKINEKDGYINQEYLWQSPYLKTANGTIYFMGNSGITIIDPANIKEFPSPHIYLNNILVNQNSLTSGKPLNEISEIQLEYDQRSITFQTGLIDYYSNKDGRIRYKMEGINEDWQFIKPGEDIQYYRLPIGHYNFLMQASVSGNNFIPAGRKISITVRPAYWQRTSLQIAFFIFLAMVLYLLTRKILNDKYKQQLEFSAKEMQLADMRQKTTELEQKTLEMEMKTLRAQMNPHFIFNSLNSVNRFILQNNKTSASSYLTKFSRLIRLILQHSQEQKVSLENELEALGLYLELESIRFENRFSYKVSVQNSVDPSIVMVPPLIIQPYAENAIWHGLMHKEDKGQLDIEISAENDHLFICITDDGVGREKAASLESKTSVKYKSMGMKITQERILNLKSGDGHEAYVNLNDLVNNDGTAAGTEVTIKIPLLYD